MVTKTDPQVSVVIPAYNHERYVAQAVESALASSVENVEVLVIDDGSTDNTTGVVRNITDRRIRCFRQENQGAHSTMNRGVSLARAPWIAFLNSDDVYHKNKLERHLDLHQLDDTAVASVSGIRHIDSNGRPLKKDRQRVVYYEQDKEQALECGSVYLSLLFKNHLITTSCLFVRKDVFMKTGGFVPLRYTHDWFMFLNLAGGGGLKIVDEPLVDYRVHSENTIKESALRLQAEIHFLLEWHLHNAVEVYKHLTPYEAFDIADANPEINMDLLAFFQLWHAANKDNPHCAAAPFEDTEHPVLKKAIQILQNDTRGALSRRQLEGILHSRSWRITAPLRKIYNLVQKYAD